MIYREVYEQGKRTLKEAQIPEAALDARLLLESICHTNHNDLLAHGEREVETAQYEAYLSLTGRRAQHIPLQQLLGMQDFMGLSFVVNEHVLVPRQDTETLVEEVLRNLHDGMRILDLCTGSGCILLSLLHYSNDCEGVGTDLSAEALAVARENAGRLLPDAKVSLLQGDLFEPVEGRFEIIVSNPPYIETDVIETLSPEVRDHEPRMALDGGADGLMFYRRILEQAEQYLVTDGMLFFEIGYNQGEAVSSLMRDKGFYEVEVVKDLAGLDRVVYGTFIRK